MMWGEVMLKDVELVASKEEIEKSRLLNPEISAEAIRGIIRSATVKYDVFPPAEEIESFTYELKNRIDKERPEDPFEFTEEEVDKWFKANRLRWVREVRPERIRTVIRKLTTAFRTRAFHAVKPEDLRLIREYIEIIPELDELRDAIVESLIEPPRTRKGAEELLRILEDVHFRIIAETLKIADRIEEGIRIAREAIEKLAKPAKKPEVSARLLIGKLKRRAPVKEEIKSVTENIGLISPVTRRKLAETVEWVKTHPPPEKAKTIYEQWRELVESAEFKKLAEVVG